MRTTPEQDLQMQDAIDTIRAFLAPHAGESADTDASLADLDSIERHPDEWDVESARWAIAMACEATAEWTVDGREDDESSATCNLLDELFDAE